MCSELQVGGHCVEASDCQEKKLTEKATTELSWCNNGPENSVLQPFDAQVNRRRRPCATNERPRHNHGGGLNRV